MNMKQTLAIIFFVVILVLLGAVGTLLFVYTPNLSYEADDAIPTVTDPIPPAPELPEEVSSIIPALPYITEAVTSTVLASSTLELTGEALGTWYFEADFPIDVINTSTQVLDTLIATAQSDWMTTSSVPFVAPFDASQYVGQTIAFVLHKDNPSGLPQFDASTTTPYVAIQ